MFPTSFKRHCLVALSQKGRERTLALYYEHRAHFPCSDHAAQLIAGNFGPVQVPGIIRREENCKLHGLIPVGFVAPYLEKGRRIRLPAFVYPEDILHVISPFELTEKDLEARTVCLKVLTELKGVAQELGVKLGVWGSAALEIHTRLKYTNSRSDLDLLIAATNTETLRAFFQIAKKFEKQYDCRIDMEIDLPGRYGVQAAELFSETEFILGKGIDDVIFVSRNDIISQINSS